MAPFRSPAGRLAGVLLAALLAATVAPVAHATVSADAAGGRLIVQMASGTVPGRAQAVASGAGVEILREVPGAGIVVAGVPAGRDPAAVARTLAARADVRWAEPDRRWRPAEATTAGLDDLVAAVNDEYVGRQWGLADIGLPAAWTVSRGDGVLVAVIDAGIDIDHPDLADNIWTNPGEVPGNGVDDDGNGYVDDVHGWDFANDDATVYDDPTVDAHGTHVAGTIAAVADNGGGVVGVAPEVTILPLKFLDDDEGGWTSDAVEAFAYAAAAGADVVNASWTGQGQSTALAEAIASQPGLVVTAAGNESADVDLTPTYPGAWTFDNMLNVTATDETGALADFANTGARTVDLAAPGVGILSTLPERMLGFTSGTSMAAPHVAGAAALVTATWPELTVPQIADLLRDTVRPSAELVAATRAGGRLDVAAAFQQAAERSATVAPPAQVAVTRLAGADRFETAARISASAFPGGAQEVYLATGTGFADALSGTAAAAAAGAPVLLVAHDTLPASVVAELRRLDPDRVRVLGGTSAVSEVVVDRVRSITHARITRLAGAGRYETSAAVSSARFAPGVPVAYVATGRGFADALAAGAAAGVAGGPVLLTDRDVLPEAIAAELARLRPDRVVVLGGSAAISERVAAAAGRAADADVERRGGASRYDTSAAVVAGAFAPGVPVAYVATGESFPDSLAGGAAAAVHAGPVLLVPPDGPLPPSVLAELQRLRPQRVVGLGGVAALPDDVLAAVRAALAA